MAAICQERDRSLICWSSLVLGYQNRPAGTAVAILDLDRQANQGIATWFDGMEIQCLDRYHAGPQQDAMSVVVTLIRLDREIVDADELDAAIDDPLRGIGRQPAEPLIEAAIRCLVRPMARVARLQQEPGCAVGNTCAFEIGTGDIPLDRCQVGNPAVTHHRPER